MAEPNDPKKETVRIALPTQVPGTKGAGETTRINLPARPPLNVPPAAPPPNAAESEADELQFTQPTAPRPTTQGPKKESAQVSAPTGPVGSPSSTVQMKKTQPLFTMPEMEDQPAVPLTITSDIELPVRSVPVSLCWTVLVISALILILQIWNYFS
jgi:hypothetical protein